MTQSELTLQPVNAKLRDKIRAKLATISDKHAAELYRENCNGLLDGVAVEGPIVVPPGLDENQTVNFITQYITAAVGIIQAALTMAAIPVGTAIGAAEIIALIGAIITYIMVWVNAMLGMITSMVEMENAAHQAVPGGQWPKAVV